ncbi:MAG: hypothetical protein PHS37_00660 [Candidatus Omnitrophica bacterium]|nr:hypothetical protein [Candidatus Omnitrophota bacterium]
METGNSIVNRLERYFRPTPLWPLLGILAVTVSIPIPRELPCFGLPVSPGTFVLLIVFIAFVFFYRARQHADWRRLEGLDAMRAIVPFIALTILAGLMNIYIFSQLSIGDLPRFLLDSLLWLEIPLAYILAANIIKNRRALLFTVAALCAVALVISFLFLQKFFYVSTLRWLYRDSALLGGDLSGVDRWYPGGWLPSFLNITLPLVVGLFLTVKNKFFKFLFAGLFIIIGASSLLTLSKSGIIALALTCMLWIFVLRHKRLLYWFVGLCVCAGLFVISAKAALAVVVILLLARIILSPKKWPAIFTSALILAVCALVSMEWVAFREYHGSKVGLSMGAIQSAMQKTFTVYGDSLRLTGEHFFAGLGPTINDQAQKIATGAKNTLLTDIYREFGILGLVPFIWFLLFFIRKIRLVLYCQERCRDVYVFGSVLAMPFFVFLFINGFNLMVSHALRIEIGITCGLLNSLMLIEWPVAQQAPTSFEKTAPTPGPPEQGSKDSSSTK